ncbi:MAG TPA: EVE domain-containing protein [Verrucomicrobiae bacterium]
MNYWLVKQEPEEYAWAAFVKDGGTAWTGVRNFQARNNLRAMRRGDPVLYYHSGEAKEIVGLARVAKEAYTDPTADDGDWVAVDLRPVQALTAPLSLAAIKADARLKTMALLRQSRLSVVPLTKSEFERVLELGKSKPSGYGN